MRFPQLTRYVKHHTRCCSLLAIILFTAGTALAETQDLKTGFEIAGSVDDIHHSFSSSGFRFQVRFRNIAYAGRVERTLLERGDSGRLKAWLALRNVTLTVNRTEITGRRHSAVCGPLQIELASSRELWLSFDLEQQTKNSTARLQIVDTRFGLPRDNWSVGSPSWVRTSGFGMTQSKVVSGLRRGLETNPKSISKPLIEEGPSLFAMVEGRIEQALRIQHVALRTGKT